MGGAWVNGCSLRTCNLVSRHRQSACNVDSTLRIVDERWARRATSAVSVTTSCRNAPLCMASVSMLCDLVHARPVSRRRRARTGKSRACARRSVARSGIEVQLSRGRVRVWWDTTHFVEQRGAGFQTREKRLERGRGWVVGPCSLWWLRTLYKREHSKACDTAGCKGLT